MTLPDGISRRKHTFSLLTQQLGAFSLIREDCLFLPKKEEEKAACSVHNQYYLLRRQRSVQF